jgi:putative SOS response-associated peptidase YedK
VGNAVVFALKGRNSDSGVPNVRNVKSPHWRRWLGVESRCVVPFTSFSENQLLPDGSRPPVWIAFEETRPLAFFSGIWTRWTSVNLKRIWARRRRLQSQKSRDNVGTTAMIR